MTSDEIHELQTARDKLRAQARCSGTTDETWSAFRAVRNRIKVIIGNAKRAFLNTAPSSNLRRFGGLSIELFTLAPGLFVQILISWITKFLRYSAMKNIEVLFVHFFFYHLV